MASTDQSLSLHQEQRLKRKHTSISSNTSLDDDGGSDSSIRSTDNDDDEDDEQLLESIKMELLRKRKRPELLRKGKKKIMVPPGFLQPLSPELRPPSAVEKDQVVVATPPPRTRSLRELVVDDITDNHGNFSSPSCTVTRTPNKDRSTCNHCPCSDNSLQPNIAEINGHTILKGRQTRHCDDLVNLGRKQSTTEVDDDDDLCSVERRAQKLQSSLPPQLPSFVKPMMPSHVGGYFRLPLPKQFCKHHLPDEVTTITLEGEKGDPHVTNYLSHRAELGAGWRVFANDHKLVEGDVLVFQLASHTKFKVYIVRSDQVDNGELNKSASADDVVREEVSDSIGSFTSTVDFKNVKSIEDFVIVIDGLVLIDPEIPKNHKVKYYELCRSQGRYLHQPLVKGLNPKLAAGIVTETVNIADAVKANYSELRSETFREWVKILSSFKGMGMGVGFLLDRVQKLMELEAKSEKLKEARMERDRVEQEKMDLQDKLNVTSEALKRHNEIGNAPW